MVRSGELCGWILKKGKLMVKCWMNGLNEETPSLIDMNHTKQIMRFINERT